MSTNVNIRVPRKFPKIQAPKPPSSTVNVNVTPGPSISVPKAVVGQKQAAGPSAKAVRKATVRKVERAVVSKLAPSTPPSAAAARALAAEMTGAQASNEAMTFIMNIVIPDQPGSPTERFASKYTDRKTAVGSGHAIENMQFLPASFLDGDIGKIVPDPNSSMRFTFHDPARNTVTFLTETQNSIYDFYMASVSSVGSVAPAAQCVMEVSAGSEPLPVRYAKVNGTAEDQPHGSYWPVGRAPDGPEGLAFFFFNSPGEFDDLTMSFTWDNVPANNNGMKQESSMTALGLTLEVYYFTGRAVVKWGDYPVPPMISGATVNLSLFASIVAESSSKTMAPIGYYAVAVRGQPYQGTPPGPYDTLPDADAYVRITAQYNVDTSNGGAIGAWPFWAHRMLPGLEDHLSTTKAIRMIGAAGKSTPSAALLEVGGTIQSYQIPKIDPWFAVGGMSTAQFSATYPDMDQRSFEKGGYGFIRPDSEKFWEFTSPVQYEGGSLRLLEFDLVPKDDYIVQYVVMPLPGGATRVPTGSAYWTTYNAWEYVTTDVWAQSKLPVARAAEIEVLVERLKNVNQWHENPGHFLSILGKLFSWGTFIGKGVYKSAKALTKAWGLKSTDPKDL